MRASAASGVLEGLTDPGQRARSLAAAGLGPSDLDDPDRLLEIERVVALTQAAARESHDDCFGLHVGLGWEFAGLGVLSYAVLNAPTVGIALRNLDRYSRFHLQAGKMGLRVRGREAFLYYEIAEIAPGRCRQHVEAALVVGLRMLRQLVGSRWVPTRVQFAHARPRASAEHVRIFGAPVVFGKHSSALVFDVADLERDVRGADRGLLPVVERHLDELLADGAPDQWLQRVRGVIAESLCDGSPSIRNLAKQMGMSVRTFQRRLDGRDAVYKTLLSEIRHDLARRYLAEGTPNLTEVAFLLGYSELSAFDRAFRRWTGSTPLAARRRLRLPG